MTTRKFNVNQQISNDCLSSTTLEIVLDEHSPSDSNDDDSNSQARPSKSTNHHDEHGNYRRQKTLINPKSHRLIEKRRRDRLNCSLADLLDLIPHKKPENQRRIEKIEIIEMAIKHMRSLIAIKQRPNLEEKSQAKLDAYRSGYQQASMDSYDFVEKNSKNDRLHANLLNYLKRKHLETKNLTAIPETTCNIQTKLTTLAEHEDSCTPVVRPAQIPSFVLHPSGTHYIPICIDASVVAHAFHSTSQSKSSTPESIQCHPVSIPVNFQSSPPSNDFYELEIQNINVIASRHQTSVRPS